MTRHGIISDIKDIEQAYETSPNRDINAPQGSNVQPENHHYYTSSLNQAQGFNPSQPIQKSKIFFGSKRAASPPLPPSQPVEPTPPQYQNASPNDKK